jgi:formylmethanofuran dehydrogenase subunit E
VPPQSCLADGVQIGSGCTLGKRNIEIVSSSDIKCEFACGERKIAFKPKQIDFPQPSSEDYSQLIENLAAKMYSMQDSELFEAVIT